MAFLTQNSGTPAVITRVSFQERWLRSESLQVLRGACMDRRRNARVWVQLPVNVWGVDAFGQAFSLPAMITSLSANGVVVQGVRRRMRIGDSIDRRMGDHKGQFRLIWIGEMAEMGLERIDGHSFLPASEVAQFAQPAACC